MAFTTFGAYEVGSFLYFAYGSNMLMSRLRSSERCPSASPLGMGELIGYELKWHKRSKRDGSGKCDIAKSNDEAAVVYGVLYDIDNSEKRALDRAEGLGHGYDQAELIVVWKGQRISAIAYVATDVDASLKPLAWYRAHVVDGAIEHSLPDAYIAALRAVETIENS